MRASSRRLLLFLKPPPRARARPAGAKRDFVNGPVDNLTRVTNALGKYVSLGYDKDNRLTSVTNELTKVWDLTLNANGWRTQLVDPNSHTKPQANGNYWKNSSNSFFYDYESRLICSFVGGITITNVYDGLGRHVGRKHSAIWTRYYYAGWQLIEERDRTGNVAADYVYGIGLDEPIRMARSGTNYYYHTDGLGSITAVTDGNGALIEQYSYDVYGMPTIYDGQTNVLSSSAISNPWMFQGRYWEPDALLYNYRFRYYHPSMGRFVQPDRAFVGSDVNLYRFCLNAPVNGLDPLGLSFWKSCAKGAAWGAGIAVAVAAAATGALELGASAAVVTEVLGALGVFGGVSTGLSIVADPSADNIGFTLGSLGGGAAVGWAAGYPLANYISPPGYTPPATKLSLSDQFYYSIGQKTLRPSDPYLDISDPIARGKRMWDDNPIKALAPNVPALLSGTTMKYGPDSGGAAAALAFSGGIVNANTVYHAVSP